MCFKILFLSAVCLAAGGVQRVSAFTLMPSASVNNVRWKEFPVRFRINPENSPFSAGKTEELVHEALNAWNGVAHSVLRIESDGSTRATALDLLNGAVRESAIVFDRDFLKNFPSTNSSVLAVGFAKRQDNAYIQGLVFVNAQSLSAISNAEVLKVVLAHELGHAFGLGHTQDPAALMFPTVQRLSRLSEDDELGVSYLYPRRELIEGTPLGCATLKQYENNGSGLPLLKFSEVLGWALGLIFAWRWIRFRVAPA